jgi:hypothetical protein
MKKNLLFITFSMILLTVSYAQTYTFTNCGATGAIGPNQTQVNNTYGTGNALNGNVTSSSGIQQWTVPVTCTYRITARGANGGGQGSTSTLRGGYGASIQGLFTLTQGNVLYIAVGQQGTANNYSGSNWSASGGGGSFVVNNTTNSILVIAGGGGGRAGNDNAAKDASISSGNGNNGNPSNQSAGGSSGSGGGASTNTYGAGGGGYAGNGTNATRAGGGLSFTNGATGGVFICSTVITCPGGFGGGGGSDHRQCTGSNNGGAGGGGGGYSGGGGGGVGGGGGFINNGTTPSNTLLASASQGSVTIEILNTTPTGASFSTGATTLCVGGSSTYTASASGGTSVIYSILSGGGASIDSITGIVSSVTSNFTVRATISNCAGSVVVDRVVTVQAAGTAPTAITGITTICSGTTTTLTATGGNANTKWFTSSCGGTQVGTGASFTTPSLTSATTYYAANEACGGITSCATTTVNITPSSTAPTAITGTTTICSGTTTTLTATGGNANTKWFTSSCGGTQVGTGATFTTPSLTTATTYYAANEACGGITSCATTTVNITPSSTAPTAITGTTTICSGTTTTLTATGGNANTKWFTSSCGGTQVGTGATFTTPSLTTATTYYAANEICGALSSCVNTVISITSIPISPAAIAGPATLCVNTIALYSTTNVNVVSYVWTLPSGWNGSSASNQINTTAGSSSGSIAVVATNNCGTSNPTTLPVTVNTAPTVSLTAFNDVCNSASPFALTGGIPSGGTYAMNGTAATLFTPAGAVRTDTILYTYTDANTCFASATQLIKVKNCTGIEGLASETIHLFPNPVTDELKVKVNKGTYEVVIYDQIGKIVENINWNLFQNEEKALNTSLYSRGIYFLSIKRVGEQMKTFKFVKKE